MGDTPTASTRQPTATDHDPAEFVLDVGGTWTRASRWPPADSASVVTVRTPSRTNQPEATPEHLVEQLIDLIVDLTPDRAPSKVAISLGATLDHRRGVVYGSAPLWGDAQAPVPLVQRLREREPEVEWVVLNDVTAMLAAYRAAHPELAAVKIVVTTISSGIAARCDDPVSGSLPTDPAGLQGEIGHLPAITADLHLPCACGQLDHVAAFASGPGLRAVAAALARVAEARESAAVDLDTAAFERTFAAALEAGDSFAHRVLGEATRPLADVFTYLLTTQPDTARIVLTGGVIDAIGGHYRRAVLRRMRERGVHHTARQHPTWLDSVLVLAQSPAETSPLVGAALLAGEATGSSS